MITIHPYYTFFQGAFRFAEGKKLTQQQYQYLMLFWGIARSKRNVSLLKLHKDPIRDLVGLPLGPEGALFVSSQEFLDLPKEVQVEFLHQREHQLALSITSVGHTSRSTGNAEPFHDKCDCHWVPTMEGTGLEWDRTRTNFEDYEFWIQYIARNILKPWGLRLEGEVWYQGEANFDTGRLVANETGSVEKQVACKVEIVNMLGAAASNYVDLAKTLPHEQLKMKDAFGRTPLMLAAWLRSYDMLEWLSSQLKGDEWQLDAQ